MGASGCRLRTAGWSAEIVADWSLESITESDPDGFGITNRGLPIRGRARRGTSSPSTITRPCPAPAEQELVMIVVYPRCGGLDVHKKQVSACRIWHDEGGKQQVEQANFGTYTRDLQRLAAWMAERGVGDVCRLASARAGSGQFRAERGTAAVTRPDAHANESGAGS